MSAKIVKPVNQSDQNLLPLRFALKAYIKEEKLKIPVLPDVVSKVMSLINQPTVNANTLARMIHKDQALASYVLRVSNSPVYAGTKEIVSLRQAIARIGARTLGKIALSITMQGKVFKAEGYEKEMTQIWRESLACGAIAQELSNVIRDKSETYYLCGLLHTVGKPVILQALDELKQEFDLPLSYEAGLSLMDEFHRSAGGKVAKQWKLPDSVQHVVEFFDKPFEDSEYRKELTVTYLANRLVRFLEREPTQEELDQILSDRKIEYLGVDPRNITNLVDKLDRIKAVLDAMAV